MLKLVCIAWRIKKRRIGVEQHCEVSSEGWLVRSQIRSFPAPSVHMFVWLGSLRMRSFSISSLGMWVTVYFMIHVPVCVSVLGRRAYVEKEKREALCRPFLFGWLRGAWSFIFIKDNDRKLLFSSLSHIGLLSCNSASCFALPRMSLFSFYISEYFPVCLSLLSYVEFLTDFSVSLWWAFTHG